VTCFTELDAVLERSDVVVCLLPLTPHAAALTEPRTAIPKIVENVERLRRGEPPLNLVDLDAGYQPESWD
jgi:phosphoglycerate dehydrogenase-like enzyme